MIGLANALLPVRNHAITWTSGDLLPVDSLGINFSEIRIKMQWFYSGNCIWKCRLQSVGYYSRSPVVCYETSYIQSAGDLVSGIPGSNPAFSRGTQLGSFRFEYRLPVPEHRNQQNKYVYRQSQVRKSTDSEVKWAECSLIIGTGCRVQVFLAWSSRAQWVCQRAFSLLAIWCLGSRVQILLSAEEHNLAPFDLNIACLCQSIEINNNKYVYRQNQVRKSTDSGVKWAECSLIIGTGCRVQVFCSLILDSSVGLSVGIQSAGDLVSGIPGSNPAFSRGTQLVSLRFEYRLPVPEHRN